MNFPHLPPRWRSSGLAGLVAAALGLSSAARADDTGYQPFPLGSRALSLGGAFTAIADDASALHYNPAGLVDAGSATVELSANLYGLEIAIGDNFFGSLAQAFGNINKIFTDLQIIPTTAGFVKSFGEKDEFGRARHAIGVSAEVPAYRSSTIETNATDSSGATEAYRRTELDRTLRGVAGYAYRVNDQLRLGVSAGLELRRLSDREETEVSGNSSRFARGDSAVDLATIALSASLGLLYSFPNNLTVGLSLESPTIELWSSADARTTRSFAVGDPIITDFTEERATAIPASSARGAILRAGVAKQLTADTLISVDLWVVTPRSYQLFVLPDAQGFLAKTLSLGSTVERGWVVNANAGVEHWLSEAWSISGGLYTNMGSAPPIHDPPGSTRQAPAYADIDTLGGTISGGWATEHTITRLGIDLSYGFGRDVIADDNRLRPLGLSAYRVVGVHRLSLFFFLGSSVFF